MWKSMHLNVPMIFWINFYVKINALNVTKTIHMIFHINFYVKINVNVPKIFHMVFHINVYVKVKHYDQIIIKLWTNKSSNLNVN
jgi:hypothetical protein